MEKISVKILKSKITTKENVMKNISGGIIAGFVATIVLSLLMIMKAKMGLMPELNVISMLASKMGGAVAMGWLAHFMIGTIGYGILFALINPVLPTSSLVTKGMVLGVLGWLVMMIVIMPMMGAGLFGLAMGAMAPVMTLVLHLIFGAVLGAVYRRV